ncbi:hypothetical protein ASE86_15220 [Sphingomonas sp. Leaf33]|uniref:hypothetical protein n=1 Tax=Sphingomonas sp. Leaf33 TaxID=1736215 RepID=UPI0006F7771A|nr:hypothetical protein [Sphingomonas sp. Leaf33]KQN20601.1 hypothetical protein ASE86_15220 [Sphingomonas sp. Leaf33]
MKSLAIALALLATTPAAARDIARACVTGDAVAAPLLARRLAEGTGIATCDPKVAPIRFAMDVTAPGFVIREGRGGTRVSARDTLGLVQGAGWLLRKADVAPGRAVVTIPRRLAEAPTTDVRMTQIGYRAKNNSLDAWTVPMFERRIEDMALWGASGVQVIAPVSDDAPNSPLFPQAPIPTLRAIGEAAHRLGMRFALYYPMLGDYADAGRITKETVALDTLLGQLPRVDDLYVPGGDPGHTAPARLFPLMKAAADVARRRNPAATVWLSTQGFDAKGLEAFYAELAKQPTWLTGVFAGPQTRDPVAIQRRRVPARYRLLLYPDIAHTMHAQFPIPEWAPEFALTQGREPINPQPGAQTRIWRHFAGLHSGFVTYSEGVADDFNQLLWFRLGWGHDGQDAAADYARMFVGDARAAAIPTRLEANWVGDPAANAGIDATLTAVDAVWPGRAADWRLDSFRYRAVYDALVRHRTIAGRAGRPEGAQIAALRQRLDDLAARLFATARLQLSVTKFGASHIERGANLDRADTPLADRGPDRSRSAEGALYDDFGNPQAEPHLVRGTNGVNDPAMFGAAIDGIADRTMADGWRMAQLTYAEALYDAPLRLLYTGLDAKRCYRIAVTYAGEDYTLPIRLVADGVHEIHPPRQRRSNPETAEFAVPAAATADGTLELAFTRPPGMGGSGRGAQIAETWLIPVKDAR